METKQKNITENEIALLFNLDLLVISIHTYNQKKINLSAFHHFRNISCKGAEHTWRSI